MHFEEMTANLVGHEQRDWDFLRYVMAVMGTDWRGEEIIQFENRVLVE